MGFPLSRCRPVLIWTYPSLRKVVWNISLSWVYIDGVLLDGTIKRQIIYFGLEVFFVIISSPQTAILGCPWSGMINTENLLIYLICIWVSIYRVLKIRFHYGLFYFLSSYHFNTGWYRWGAVIGQVYVGGFVFAIVFFWTCRKGD